MGIQETDGEKMNTVRILSQGKKTVYFMLVKVLIVLKQFRTICDFTFATSHEEYLLSCSAILFSNCPKSLDFPHNNSQSEM